MNHQSVDLSINRLSKQTMKESMNQLVN